MTTDGFIVSFYVYVNMLKFYGDLNASYCLKWCCIMQGVSVA